MKPWQQHEVTNDFVNPCSKRTDAHNNIHLKSYETKTNELKIDFCFKNTTKCNNLRRCAELLVVFNDYMSKSIISPHLKEF